MVAGGFPRCSRLPLIFDRTVADSNSRVGKTTMDLQFGRVSEEGEHIELSSQFQTRSSSFRF
jgi:hypothetical protein